MGEDEVLTAAFHRDRQAQVVGRDRTAFDVPSWPPGAECAAVPCRLAFASAAPQQRVERVTFAGTVGVAATLGEELAHLLLVQMGNGAEPRVGAQVGID